MKDTYGLLLERLDQFIRKFYVNQLLRGTLYTTGLILALFLGLNFAEYYFYFPPAVKLPLFWSFVAVSGVTLFYWVVIPVMHYYHLGKTISHEQAAQIIGNHFPNVKDKLLNVLQLRTQAGSSNAPLADEHLPLLLASINQKSDEIKLVPFKAAIDLSNNKKYLRYALPPLLLLIFMLFAAPSLLKNASSRLFNYNKEFEREAPFKISLDKNQLKVVQFQNFDLKVTANGAILPNELFIERDGYQYKLKKDNDTSFSYTFANVQKDIPFRIFAGAVNTPLYNLQVLKKPNIVGFDVQLEYPAYIGRKNEILSNQGDLVIPTGTKINWIVNAENTDNIQLSFAGGKPQSVIRQGESRFIFSKQVRNDEPYRLFISNNFLNKADSVTYNLTVVPDLFPTISVQKFDDSLNKKRFYFAGEVGDDYGVRNLSFNYQIKRAEAVRVQNPEPMQRIPLQIPVGKQAQYQYTLNVSDLNLQPGDEVNYYFEVFDNDAINGAKSAKTNMMVFSQPSLEQVEKQITKNNDEIKEDLKKAVQETKKVQQDLEKLREKLLQQKEIDWQTKKEAERLQQRQQELNKQIDEAKKSFDENLKSEKELQKDQNLLQKQEQLQKMFEELKNPEMKDLLKQIEDLLQKMDKDKALDKMEEMKFSSEEMQKELERMEELMKQSEVENMMQEQIDKLDELAKKEDELSNKSEDTKQNQEDLKKQQEDINKQFDKLQEKKDELEKKNKELKRPEKIPDTKEDDKGIKEDLKDSKEQLEQKQNSKAAKKQKSAANKMKEKANKMKSSQQQGKEQEMEEDMKAIRQLLENLVQLSFDQEATMKDMGSAVENTPRYIKDVQQQKKLQGDFAMIEDSLQNLAKRQVAIQTFVVEKVTDVKQNMASALEKLEDRKKFEGQDFQQRSMKNVNDLALMLAESMKNMQDQMNQMSGNGSCSKPGGKKPNGKGGKEPGDKLSEGQKGVNEGLKQMLDRLKKGQGGGSGKPGSSKEFAEMAAKQSAMREALKKKQQELQQRGKGEKGLQDMIDGMEKTETELVNKQLTNETMKRQDDIMTRLLESEKAERERKEDEERKANTAKQVEAPQPPALQEYIKKRQSEIEQFRTVSPALKPYYKQLVEEYFKSLK